MSHVTSSDNMPSPRYGIRFEAVSRLWRSKFNTFRIPRKCSFPANFAVWQLIFVRGCSFPFGGGGRGVIMKA